jgi:ectoine hydroxylase-related dioxygenase (phytanoyl-CoA dioxygenase family)
VLSAQQLVQFARDGYLLIPDVVDEALLSALDSEVDRVVQEAPPPEGKAGFHFYFLPPEQLPAADAALRASPALRLAEALVAPHALRHQLDHIQIALNLPGFDHRPGAPHIDGNTPSLEQPATFTMLAAVFLVDESAPDHGNLWIWPGSHWEHERVFRELGPTALLQVGGHAALLDPEATYARTPFPLLAKRGDLLLAHHLLGHNIGGNTSATCRRIAYYRLGCDGHGARSQHTLTDALLEYAPVRAAAQMSGL